MSYHALVVDDMPDVLEEVKDRLESLGHTCDCASAQQPAREYLAQNQYSYILLDLEIPVRYGRPSRVPNGKNLVREIREMDGHAETPIIVMTSHGHDAPDLAVDVMRGNGAIDYVKKPFPEEGHTLEKAVQDALHSSGRSRAGAATRSGPSHTEAPQPFEQGEMVFGEHRIELCGVRVCGGTESGLIREILDELRCENSRGGFVQRSGDDLARLTGCKRGQNAIAEAVAAFRTQAAEQLLAEANILIDRKQDIIVNDGRHGYRLSPKITVHDADDCQSPARGTVNGLQTDALTVGDDPELNPRQRWAIGRMATNGEFRKADIMAQFKCSTTTAERDLRDLRRQGRIEFVGPAKTGYWRLLGQH